MTVDADSVRTVLDGSQGTFDVFNALFRARLKSKVVFTHLSVACSFGRMVVAVRPLVSIRGEIVFALKFEKLRLKFLKASLGDACLVCVCHHTYCGTHVGLREIVSIDASCTSRRRRTAQFARWEGSSPMGVPQPPNDSPSHCAAAPIGRNFQLEISGSSLLRPQTTNDVNRPRRIDAQSAATAAGVFETPCRYQPYRSRHQDRMRFVSHKSAGTMRAVHRRLRRNAAALAAGATVFVSALSVGAATDAKAALRCVGPLDAGGIDQILSDGGSPLTGQGATFVSAGASVGIDPRALVAIGAHESVLLTYRPAADIHNPFGIGPNRRFPDDGSAITAAAQLLASKYLSEGRLTIAQISSKWAPLGVSNDPTNLNANWTSGVGSLYARLGGNPDQPITLGAQISSSCGAAPVTTATAPVNTAAQSDTNAPLVPPGVSAPNTIVWAGKAPSVVGPGMAGGNDPITGEPATMRGFVFPVIPGTIPVRTGNTFSDPAPEGATGCYHVPARCATELRGTAGLSVVAATAGTLIAATSQEQRNGVAFWIRTSGRDRIGYSGLGSYAPRIAHRTAVAAGQLLGRATPSLTITWERDGRVINAAPLLRATLDTRP